MLASLHPVTNTSSSPALPLHSPAPVGTTVSETGQALPSWGFCPDREQAPTREEGVNGTLGEWQALGTSRGLRWVDVVESEGVAGPITPQEF